MKIQQKSNINYGKNPTSIVQNAVKEKKFPNTTPTGFIGCNKKTETDAKFPNTSLIDFGIIFKKEPEFKNVEKPSFNYYF